MNIDAGVFNHVSGYFADVVWKGLSTYHVREAIEKELSLEELREYWLPISPMTYMDRLAAQPWRPQRYIYTLYDLTFPDRSLTRHMRELRRQYQTRRSRFAMRALHARREAVGLG
jgi:hypothetical protein